jgi:hypothetical protein
MEVDGGGWRWVEVGGSGSGMGRLSILGLEMFFLEPLEPEASSSCRLNSFCFVISKHTEELYRRPVSIQTSKSYLVE